MHLQGEKKKWKKSSPLNFHDTYSSGNYRIHLSIVQPQVNNCFSTLARSCPLALHLQGENKNEKTLSIKLPHKPHSHPSSLIYIPITEVPSQLFVASHVVQRSSWDKNSSHLYLLEQKKTMPLWSLWSVILIKVLVRWGQCWRSQYIT